MAEYLGYQGRPEGIDWSGIADKAITGLDTIKKDREAQRAALEKSADDLVSASKEYKPGQSGSFNNLILSGADRVRTNTLDLKKELMAGRLTPTEYKARVGRMSEDWKYLGDYAKSYNDIVNKQVEYLNDPKASALGEYFLQKQANLADVANKQLVVDPNTNGIVMTDPDTGLVVDFKSLLIPENQTPEKVDLLGQVAGFTKNLGAVTGYDSGFWTKSAQLNPAYKKAKENFSASLLKNPRSAASILSDYVGDYEFYETEQQKKNIPAGKGIQLVMGPNGIATPKLTPEQLKAAQAVIERQVDAEVEKLREKPEAVKYEKPTEGEINRGQAQQNINDRRVLVDAIYDDPTSYKGYIYDKEYKAGESVSKVTKLTPRGIHKTNGIAIERKIRKIDDKGKVIEALVSDNFWGDEAKHAINDILNVEDKISYEKVYKSRPVPAAAAAPTKLKKLPGIK
jgi:hypothetical protein